MFLCLGGTQGAAVKDMKNGFHHIPHVLHCVCVCVYNTSKFVWSFHNCGTYYKVGELAHTLKYISNKNKILET